MEKRKLYLLMQAFPVKQREASFITPELPYLKENFDVTVVPLEECSHSAFGRCKALIKSVCSPLLYKQVAQAKKEGKNAFKVFQFSLFMLWRANTYADYLKKNVFGEKDAIVYGYWYNEVVLSALLLKDRYPDYKYITRCHGYDVYDFRVPGDFHPYKKFMDEKLDKIVFACSHAKQYYLERHNKTDGEKYLLSYLGVPPKSNAQNTEENSAAEKDSSAPIRLVSCSSVIPLKRVGLIIDALKLIEDINIDWHHFGDGSQMEDVKKQAKQLKDKTNISYTLHGYVPNAEYIDILGDMKADLFVTTSSTEGGVPVSLSEAASFGLPIVATAVGGIPEIVSEANGILMGETPSAEEVAGALKDFCSLSPCERAEKGRNSYRKWEQTFNSRNNSQKFVNLLKQL